MRRILLSFSKQAEQEFASWTLERVKLLDYSGPCLGHISPLLRDVAT